MQIELLIAKVITDEKFYIAKLTELDRYELKMWSL